MFNSRKFSYISLFSGAGIACHSLKDHSFQCIATNELLEKRLKIQQHNQKCKYESGYICGDISVAQNKQKIHQEIRRWEKHERLKEVDLLIATPPCQGMSVANHKPKDENLRNSLIIESIKLVDEILPRYLVFENVRTFLKTQCTDIDGQQRPIGEAIDANLAGKYNITKQIINFKDYGSNSSRTRCLVIGVRKDLKDITPYDIFPSQAESSTLRQIIGKYKRLNKMGEIDPDNIYHHFKPYNPYMLEWLRDIKEGQSAFDNKDPVKRPHQIKNGRMIANQNKNGDKYRRCIWDKAAPCIHTRNDIVSSQSTIHPVDNRVFSISELMDLMTIPASFKWVGENINTLNAMPLEEKEAFLKKEAMNIRQCIGEAVPSIIFASIAKNIRGVELTEPIKDIIKENNLSAAETDLTGFVRRNLKRFPYKTLSRVIEMVNTNKESHAAFYTPQSICYGLVKDLPEFKNKDTLRILEPSVGMGNFIPLLAQHYSDKKIILDVVDIDQRALQLLELFDFEKKYKNLKINYICDDFLLNLSLDDTIFAGLVKYDLAIANPPFGKVKDRDRLRRYRDQAYNKTTSNYFSFFLEKLLSLTDTLAIITPKSVLGAPEFNLTRELIQDRHDLQLVIDHGEKGFNGVKIETVGLIINSGQRGLSNGVKVESYITDQIHHISKNDLFDKDFNSWLLYKDKQFKAVKDKLHVDIYSLYRDRAITKAATVADGKIRVLKARNLGSNRILNIEGYDTFIGNNISDFPVSKYLNTKAVLIPNLSYKPRACFLPKNSIADGSVAILQPKNGFTITKRDLEYYATEEFRRFYMIGRNLGTRSLNIDSNSICLWGLLKEKHRDEHQGRN